MCAAFFFPRGLRVSSGGETWSPVDKASSNEYDRLHCGKGHFFVVCVCVFVSVFQRVESRDLRRDLLIDPGFE